MTCYLLRSRRREEADVLDYLQTSASAATILIKFDLHSA